MEREIFKNASTTYYWSSKFFPKKVRNDVFKLYSFVRTADDFVDQTPQDTVSFYELKSAWEKKSKPKNQVIIDVIRNINELTEKYGFERNWIDAFLAAMEQDISPKKYRNLDDSLAYVYGSAEVVGLMMAKIFGLPEEAFNAARMQGRAMQWVNFIRDIDEDVALHRCYFPEQDLKKFGLKDLSKSSSNANPESFKQFVHMQIKRYEKWQHEAEAGYEYIPRRYLTPVKTAANLYSWTADEIKKDPFVVYKKKVKPTKGRVVYKVLTNMV